MFYLVDAALIILRNVLHESYSIPQFSGLRKLIDDILVEGSNELIKRN